MFSFASAFSKIEKGSRRNFEIVTGITELIEKYRID
jgi:hypothetical protein